jgi:cellulose synthase/poly-beta-1,6-N-acetylglucosamine synthase-like glycosyltransferase
LARRPFQSHQLRPKILRPAYIKRLLSVLPVLGFALWLLLDALLELLPILLTLVPKKARLHTVVPSCSVVIPAYNEASDLQRTLEAVCAQDIAGLRVLVMDDGSTDATAAIAAGFAESDSRVALHKLVRGGKAHALNTALAIADTEVFVTVDADTLLAPGAIAELLVEFSEPAVEAASGFIVATPSNSILGHFQRIEFLRASALRAGFSQLGMHEQAPGAFTAFRTNRLRAAGGFPNSLTEDYEVVFRLYDKAREEGRRILVRSSLTAYASTSTVHSLAGLHAQRTRWFAGFLVTLWRYRTMLFDRRLGAFGLIRLPLKALDAVLPVLSVCGWILAARLHAAQRAELAVLAVGVTCNVVATAIANRGARKLRAREWLLLPFEPLYAMLRTLLVMRAYVTAARSGRTSGWLPNR